jgi:predicted O-methyltransferase YrrM
VATEPDHAALKPQLDAQLNAQLNTRLDALCKSGWALWEQFEADVRDHAFHPFVAADYEVVRAALVAHRKPGQRFLEWGSATGVITIMADLLGFRAYGIELDGALVARARALAASFDSRATFATGSFLPTGYRFKPRDGNDDMGTLGEGPSGYLQLGLALGDFDVVFGYPWGGESPVMLDVMQQYGAPDALLLLHDTIRGVRVFRGGREC